MGEITGIDFESKKEGAYPKGYCLMTALMKEDGRLDESDTRAYTISGATHAGLILPADNTKYTFVSA